MSEFDTRSWPSEFIVKITKLREKTYSIDREKYQSSPVSEFGLEAIGSNAVVSNRTFEVWEKNLSSPQKKLLNKHIDTSIRIVGPAGSGKTLSLLCVLSR